jgi:Domain of unknown function (DUF4167)
MFLRSSLIESNGGAHSIRDGPSASGFRLKQSICPYQGMTMQNRRVDKRRARPVGPFVARSKATKTSSVRSLAHGAQSAQRSYERYLALAQEEARAGNMIGAENYYQHAEHYFRMISANRPT